LESILPEDLHLHISLHYVHNEAWLCGPPSRLSNGYRGLFLRGKSGRGVKLTTHIYVVPRL
jgi:hypothetical protein